MDLLESIRAVVKDTENHSARASSTEDKARIHASGFVEIQDLIHKNDGGPKENWAKDLNDDDLL